MVFRAAIGECHGKAGCDWLAYFIGDQRDTFTGAHSEASIYGVFGAGHKLIFCAAEQLGHAVILANFDEGVQKLMD
jgi:hypothetical protein